jgi:hypothetical protein
LALSWDAAAESEVPLVEETEAKTSAKDVPSGYRVADDARALKSEFDVAPTEGVEYGANEAMRA